MNRPEPGRDPESEVEDQGIPDLEAGAPGQWSAEDPEQEPIPGESPAALDSFGTTADEQRTGEDLDGRLARELPDIYADPDAPEIDEDASAAVRPTSRLVAKDEGAHASTEKDEVAYDAGPDAGGYGPEEQAVRIDLERPGRPRPGSGDPDSGADSDSGSDSGDLG